MSILNNFKKSAFILSSPIMDNDDNVAINVSNFTIPSYRIIVNLKDIINLEWGKCGHIKCTIIIYGKNIEATLFKNPQYADIYSLIISNAIEGTKIIIQARHNIILSWLWRNNLCPDYR